MGYSCVKTGTGNLCSGGIGGFPPPPPGGGGFVRSRKTGLGTLCAGGIGGSPSPLGGEGGFERSRTRVRGLHPRIEPPHPALRATFSHKGRRGSELAATAATHHRPFRLFQANSMSAKR